MNTIKNGATFGLSAAIVFSLFGLASLIFAQTLSEFAPGDLVSSSQINNNFANLKSEVTTLKSDVTTLNEQVTELTSEVAPIGSIVAWHNNISGVPAISDRWVPCNGQPISDPDSPMVGQSVPNLNGGRGYFLRGGTTAGVPQDDELQDHRHTTHARDSGNHFAKGDYYSGSDYTFAFEPGRPNTWTGGIVEGRRGSETRPINMSVVWVMRIK